jgi:ubiquitin-conjugating enzyme E2 J1
MITVRILLILSAAIIGLQGFFPLKGQAAVGVGSIEYPISERKRLAAL